MTGRHEVRVGPLGEPGIGMAEVLAHGFDRLAGVEQHAGEVVAQGVARHASGLTMRLAGLARMGALALLWGSNFLWIKYALEGFSPVQVTLLRLALGAATLLMALRLTGVHLPTGRRVWAHFVVAALVANALPYWLFAYGEQHVPSSLAGAINATTPLWTVAVALLIRAEARPTHLRLVGLAMGFLGVLVLLQGSPSECGNCAGTSDYLAGFLACLAASASYGIAYAYMARFLTPRDVPALALAAGQLLAATGLLLLVTPFAGMQPMNLSATAVAGALVLGILGTGVAYVLNFRLITDDGPSAASTVTYLLPIVSITLGVTVGSEEATSPLLVGTVVVLVGVVLVRRSGRPLPAPAVAK
jgi:drug/metabolite transporter (DMT)-like permease